MDGFFHRLGDTVARHRWIVVALWLVALVAAGPGVTKVSSALVSGGFQVPSSDSGRGTSILEQEFGRKTVTTAVLVFNSGGVTIDDQNDRTFDCQQARSRIRREVHITLRVVAQASSRRSTIHAQLA